MEDFRDRAVAVLAPLCDTSDGPALAATMDHCTKLLPSVCGCVHLSGALKVRSQTDVTDLDSHG